jgi:hypothetical protein
VLFVGKEANQQETVDYDKFAFVDKTPAAYIRKRKIAVHVVARIYAGSNDLPVFNIDGFE